MGTKKSEVYNIDCLDYMKTVPDKFFGLCLADPPYGVSYARGKNGWGVCNNRPTKEDVKWDDKIPQKVFFDELLRISERVIIWGGNYFDLPPTRCFVCWDKVQPWENFAQVELAWTDLDWPAQLFRYDNRQGGKIHPTQKPVELYIWILKKFAHDGDTIFDPMMGSQSSRIAAYKMGFDYVGCELDKEYFDKGCERFNRECKGEITTKDGSVIKQMSLFDE